MYLGLKCTSTKLSAIRTPYTQLRAFHLPISFVFLCNKDKSPSIEFQHGYRYYEVAISSKCKPETRVQNLYRPVSHDAFSSEIPFGFLVSFGQGSSSRLQQVLVCWLFGLQDRTGGYLVAFPIGSTVYHLPPKLISLTLSVSRPFGHFSPLSC